MVIAKKKPCPGSLSINHSILVSERGGWGGGGYSGWIGWAFRTQGTRNRNRKSFDVYMTGRLIVAMCADGDIDGGSRRIDRYGYGEFRNRRNGRNAAGAITVC